MTRLTAFEEQYDSVKAENELIQARLRETQTQLREVQGVHS
jgi:hypothetical protein